jgi:cytochrome c
MHQRIGILICLGLAILFASIFFISCGERTEHEHAAEQVVLPSMPKPNPGPSDELPASIKRGKALFNDNTLGTSGMSCNSCHSAGGTKDNPQEIMGMKINAFDNLGARHPQYVPTVGKVMTLSSMVNFCIITPLKGKALSWNDQKLIDLVAYCASVKKAE